MKLNTSDFKLLEFIYNKYCENSFPLFFDEVEASNFFNKEGFEMHQITALLKKLKENFLIIYKGANTYEATWLLIRIYEKYRRTDAVFHNNQIRINLLEIFTNTFIRDSNLTLGPSDLQKEVSINSFTQTEVLSNLWALNKMALIEGNFLLSSSYYFKLSGEGFDLFQNKAELTNEFPISLDDTINIETVCEIVEKWIPSNKRKVEESYKAELAEHLRNQQIGKVIEEKGDSDVDILINDKLPIEIKKNPNKSELDRLTGQVKRMLKEFDSLIVVIIETSTHKDQIEDFIDLHSSEIESSKFKVILKA